MNYLIILINVLLMAYKGVNRTLIIMNVTIYTKFLNYFGSDVIYWRY
jgi:hypothetical protein